MDGNEVSAISSRCKFFLRLSCWIQGASSGGFLGGPNEASGLGVLSIFLLLLPNFPLGWAPLLAHPQFVATTLLTVGESPPHGGGNLLDNQ